MSFNFARSCNSCHNHIALLQGKSLCWLTFKERYYGPFKCKRVRWFTLKRKCWELLNRPWDAADLSNAEKQKDRLQALNVFVEEMKWRYQMKSGRTASAEHKWNYLNLIFLLPYCSFDSLYLCFGRYPFFNSAFK
jgi:hypothetical protein